MFIFWKHRKKYDKSNCFLAVILLILNILMQYLLLICCIIDAISIDMNCLFGLGFVESKDSGNMVENITIFGVKRCKIHL